MKHTYSFFSFLPAVAIISCLLLLFSCAQIVAPSGGKIDDTPPRVKHYYPDSAAVHFKSSTIEIEFDEYIQLKDLNNQLVISPPMQKSPLVRVRNKTLLIDFKEPLKDSTTYTINFGTAIQDNHESKPLTGFKYVFSTGNYVDSLFLTGQVLNALTHVPEKGILVMLYSSRADSAPYSQLPSYFGRSDANGNYKITNIKKGIYRVLALQDGNGNYKFNPGEMIGFRAELLELKRSDTTNFLVFKEEVEKQKLRRAWQDNYGKIKFAFVKPVEGLRIKPLNHAATDKDQIVIETNAVRDTVTYWFTSPGTDSLILEIADRYKVYDTLRYKLITRAKMISNNKGLKPVVTIKSNAKRGKLFDLGTPLTFELGTPILGSGSPAPDKVFLREDTSKANLFRKGKWDWKNPERTHRFEYWQDTASPFAENKKYHLLILPGAYKDMFGFVNDTLVTEFKTQDSRFYGTLKMHLHIASGQYLFQLLDESGNVFRERPMTNGGDLDFDYLPPARYQARLIYDANANGVWDTGNYLKHRQPETVIYNNQTITIRSNWDQEIDWYVK
ncbi:MAG TPA: Ig-like domain-containing protein [Bacteroidia bacterium]|jgi:hypothetical protein|nr:Ig-like domain-containing protein [Bacteroidia bacterium]